MNFRANTCGCTLAPLLDVGDDPTPFFVAEPLVFNRLRPRKKVNAQVRAHDHLATLIFDQRKREFGQSEALGTRIRPATAVSLLDDSRRNCLGQREKTVVYTTTSSTPSRPHGSDVACADIRPMSAANVESRLQSAYCRREHARPLSIDRRSRAPETQLTPMRPQTRRRRRRWPSFLRATPTPVRSHIPRTHARRNGAHPGSSWGPLLRYNMQP